MKTKTTFQILRRSFLRLMMILAFTGMFFSANATTVYLRDGHDGTWETVSNWVISGGAAYGALPQTGDYVIIPSSVVKPTLTINSNVTIQKLQVKALTLTISNGASLTVNQGSDTSSPTISLATGSIVNNGTLAVYAGPATAAHNLISLDGDVAATSSTFTNNGTLTLDNSAVVGVVNTTPAVSCFNYNQTTSGATPAITLNQGGTINLNLKPATAASASVAGFTPQIFNVASTGVVNASLSGNVTFGSTATPLSSVKVIAGGSASSTLTIPAGSTITSYNQNSGSISGFFGQYAGVLSNAGTLNFHAPAALSYAFWELYGLINTGTINITGNVTGKCITFSTKGTSVLPVAINNSGTLNVNLTGSAVPLSGYCGYFSGTWVPGTSVATNGVFQVTNTGTMNLYSTASLGIAIGNSDPNSWFKNSGTLRVHSAIASGFTNTAKSAALNYYYAPATSPMNYFNSGTVIFDLATNTNGAFIQNLGTAEGTTTNPNFNYSKVLFVNQYNGVGGIVAGRGTFLAGSFDYANSALGTLSPGCGTITLPTSPTATAATTQVNTLNIGEFDLQGTSVSLKGTVIADVEGTTAGTSGYDQIINSTASGVLDVSGVNLSLTLASGYKPDPATAFDVFKATGTSGTHTGTLASVTGGWTANYTVPSTISVYDISTAVQSVLDISTISVVNNKITVKDTLGKTVNVYTVTGELAKTAICTDVVTTLTLHKGLYLVSINGKSAKVLIR